MLFVMNLCNLFSLYSLYVWICVCDAVMPNKTQVQENVKKT